MTKGAAETLLCVKVGRFDNQTITLVVSDRVPQPFVHFVMLAVFQADNARIMIHLSKNHHVVISLNDLAVIVVENRQHRWPTGRAETDQAALTHGPHFRAIECALRAHTAKNTPLSPFGPRQASVLRLHDNRGSDAAVNHGHSFTRIHPERVVASDLSLGPAHIADKIIKIARSGFTDGSRLFGADHQFTAELLTPFQHSHRGNTVHAL